MYLHASNVASNAEAVAAAEYCGYIGSNNTRSMPSRCNCWSLARILGAPQRIAHPTRARGPSRARRAASAAAWRALKTRSGAPSAIQIDAYRALEARARRLASSGTVARRSNARLSGFGQSSARGSERHARATRRTARGCGASGDPRLISKIAVIGKRACSERNDIYPKEESNVYGLFSMKTGPRIRWNRKMMTGRAWGASFERVSIRQRSGAIGADDTERDHPAVL